MSHTSLLSPSARMLLPLAALMLCALGAQCVVPVSAAAGAAGAAGPCTWRSEGQSYDFSSLQGTEVSLTYGPYPYVFSICGPLSASGAGAACQAKDPSASICFDGRDVAGYWQPNNTDGSAPAWSFTDANQGGVQYHINGASCSVSTSDRYVANVKFICARTQGAWSMDTYGQWCGMDFTLPTPLACPTWPPPPMCAWNGYDFTSLGAANVAGTDAAGNAYVVRVCGALQAAANTQACLSQSATASACALSSVSGGGGVDQGDWGDAASNSFGFIDAAVPMAGVEYVMAWGKGVTTRVQLVCAKNSGPLKVYKDAAGTQFNYTLPTILACPAYMRQQLLAVATD
jgi:hypothetical protein